jgi:hypothetical protein
MIQGYLNSKLPSNAARICVVTVKQTPTPNPKELIKQEEETLHNICIKPRDKLVIKTEHVGLTYGQIKNLNMYCNCSKV